MDSTEVLSKDEIFEAEKFPTGLPMDLHAITPSEQDR
jgi:hypothetical protein